MEWLEAALDGFMSVHEVVLCVLVDGECIVIYGVEFALPSASSKLLLKPSKVLASCPPLA